MRNSLAIVILGAALAANGQVAQTAGDFVPSGKGWGVQISAAKRGTRPAPPSKNTHAPTQGNGIYYHGGPVLKANPVPVYFIWYGNWTNGPKPSDSQTTIGLIDTLYGPTRGLGGSPYFKIATTYSDTTGAASGNVAEVTSARNNYSRGKAISDADVATIVNSAISSAALPKDPNGIYIVVTSSDVNETSGFCTNYCGWHNHALMGGSDIKYAFVGNPDRCPSACEVQSVSPNRDSGADGMASIMAHETMEAVTDPDLNAWYDASGNEVGDKCAWKYGPLVGSSGTGFYNETLGTYEWLLQMEWENSRGGGCAQKQGGAFYTR